MFWFYVLAFGIAAYAIFAYGFLPLGSLVHPDMQVAYLANKLGIYTHIFASAVALSLSPFQFTTALRNKWPKVHRIIGRMYLGVGVALGGLSGLYMAFYAFGGPVAKVGFAGLALCWLYTGVRALQAIRRGDVQEHRKWVVRNVSLTLAAVTLRIYLPSSMVFGIPFEVAYPFIAWLCWVPNLLVAELLFNRLSGGWVKPKQALG
ncbi:MAG: DUF2306 domain-containing protein [Natronospirillum sp.]